VIDYLVVVPVGYLIGSVPFGLLIGRVVGGVDIRSHGSGKTGMTNVMRKLGFRIGIVVLILDMGKAMAVVALARAFSGLDGAVTAAGLAALAGHIWPVFVGFKGGRGIAPGWGGLVLISPWAGLVATLTGLPAVAASRYVSLGSLVGSGCGAGALVVLCIVGAEPFHYIWYGAVGWPLLVFKHRDNIRRLIRGEERRLGQRVKEDVSRPSHVGAAGSP